MLSTEAIQNHSRRIDARIKTIHDRTGCARWESYQSPVLVGNKRKPDLLDGFGCPEHHIWIMGEMGR